MAFKTRLKCASLLLILCGYQIGCSSKPYIVDVIATVNPTAKTNTIYITNHGWHTGIVIPLIQIETILPSLAERFPDAHYLELGWGDKGYYQAQEITTGLTLKAMFWPTDTVIHAVAVSKYIKQDFPASQIESLCLNDNQLNSLLKYISNSFYKTPQSEIVATKKGIYGDSQFYQAEGEYYLMNTCNKWTAKGLRSAGFNISSFFKLTASSVVNDPIFLKSKLQPQSVSCI